jgi:hypothetical protein
MSIIAGIVENLKSDWDRPKLAIHDGNNSPFKHHCIFSDQSVGEVASYILGYNIPSELQEFWQISESAVLFKDADYGQWGVEILPPSDVVIETEKFTKDQASNCQDGDIIIGRFLGDSDLLMIRCDKAEADFGCVHIVLPIDDRPDWPVVGKDFTEFLMTYCEKQGSKYWE